MPSGLDDESDRSEAEIAEAIEDFQRSNPALLAALDLFQLSNEQYAAAMRALEPIETHTSGSSISD